MFRIESLNILLFLVDSLEKSLQIIHNKLSLKVADLDEVRQDIGEILDNLSESLSQELPSLPEQGITRLDKLIKERRDGEWTLLSQDVHELRMHLDNTVDNLVTDVEDFKFRLKALAKEVRNQLHTLQYL